MMNSNLAQKLQYLKQLLDNGLLTPAEYERERETLLEAWRAVSAPSSPAVSIDLDSLPTVIALPLREYLDEANPVLKLWYACDSVEMLLRLVVMMGLAALGQRGPLTLQLRKQLQEYRLEEPTLGNWRAMAEAVVEALGAAPNTLPELPGLVRDTLAPLLHGPSKGERDESNSFIRLRNRLAHGGGISRALAQRLEEIWQPRLWAILEQLTWLTTVDLVVRDEQGGYGVLRGPNPEAQPYSPRDPIALAQTFVAGDAVVLVRGEVVLPLWPLALYGAPRSPNPDAPSVDEIVPQVYLRRGEVRLQYTPLGALAVGSSESEAAALERFVDWFKVTEESRSRPERQFQVRDFTAELRKDGLRVLGRADECKTLNDAVAERTEGVIWVSGVAGIGKSYVFAWLALRLLDEPPPDTLVLPYRFRAGDERCSREVFLRFAVERLAAWLEIEVETDSTPWLKRLRGLLGQLAGRRVVFLLDGLDEIAARDARFAQEVPLALMGPGILWVCAGRPDYDLPMVFAAGAHQPFPDGLPKMDAGDIRTLLLERIGPLRKHLLRHDQEQGERIGNPFVEKVAQAAAGVPLYVKYVIDDIFAGRYRVLDGYERLPPSLSAYYEELLRRLSVGDLHQVLTPLAATLAVALEPLDATALAALLRRRGKLVPEGEKGLRLVEQGLSAIASMLKRALTLEGRDGYTLYHLSLRQHMATSEHSQAAVVTAREVLGDLALDVAPDTAAPYLYRCGITHLLEMHRAEKALGLLTQFEYLIDRLRTLTDSEDVEELGEDWRATVRHAGPLDREQRLWEAFWREREHILRRGDHRWPAYKILLQLAVEHADDSPVTRQAEAWLEAGHCDWVWLHNPKRIKHAAPNPCLRAFEGHTGLVNGALELADGRIVSWSQDGTLRLWDRERSTNLAVLAEHTDSVEGATILMDGRILSWSTDRTLRLWDGASGSALAVLDGHTKWYKNCALELRDGRILSYSDDDKLRLWDRESGCEMAVLDVRGYVDGARELADGKILSWGGSTLRIWDWVNSTEMVTFPTELPPSGYWGRFNGALELKDGRLLAWSDDYTLRLWNGASGNELIMLAGHSDKVIGALELVDGRFLSWSWDGTLRLWDGVSGSELAVLDGHTDTVNGALELADGRFLSWSWDGTLRLWDGESGSKLAVLAGHTDWVNGALELRDGRLLSWSQDGTLRLWDEASGSELMVLVGHSYPINGAFELKDGGILSWADDGTLRLWDESRGTELPALAEHVAKVNGVLELLQDRRLLSWSQDGTLRLWDGESGSKLAVLAGHTDWVNGALELRDGRLLSWSQDGTLRLWDETNGSELAVLAGHNSEVIGARELRDERLLSWSRDGTLWLWDEANGSELAVLAGHYPLVNDAIELRNGQILSWGARNSNLWLWDVVKGHELAELTGHTNWVNGALELRDGRLLSWSRDGTLRLWDGASGSELAMLAGDTDWVNGAHELADGRILSWGPTTLRLWDGATGSELAMLAGDTDWVKGARDLADGQILSWADQRSPLQFGYTLRLWYKQSGAPTRTIHQADAPWLAPSWLVMQQEITNPKLVQSQFVGWHIGKMSGIADGARPSLMIPVWHGDSKIQTRILLSDGTLVVTLDSGHVFFLKLHHGGRRISLAEWHDLPQTDV